jgi:polyisoprenoid-binding protein YceI
VKRRPLAADVNPHWTDPCSGSRIDQRIARADRSRRFVAVAGRTIAVIELAVLCSAALPVAGAVASTWEIDPVHTTVEFSVRHMMVSNVRGQLGKVAGTVDADEKNPSHAVIKATIDAASIDTRNEDRDKHLRGPDFLDVAQYPTITFASKKIEKAKDGHWNVTGDLTLHGVTRAVVLDVEGPTQPVKDPYGKTRAGAHASTKFNRKDFGIVWSKTLDGGGAVVGDEITVTIDVEVVRRPD